jgi:hypothetical protein
MEVITKSINLLKAEKMQKFTFIIAQTAALDFIQVQLACSCILYLRFLWKEKGFNH